MTNRRIELFSDKTGAKPSPLPESVRAAARRATAQLLVRNEPGASSEDLYELLAMLDLLPAPTRSR